MRQSDDLQTEYRVSRDVPVEMRDGCRLAADVYYPADTGTQKLPTVLIRTPYDKMMPWWIAHAPRAFAGKGYVTVFQDVRGTGASGGTFEPFHNESWGERRDGEDTIAWIGRQSWSNGQVATFGPSYLGSVQLTLLTMNVPGHAAAFIEVPAVNKQGMSWIYNGHMLDLQTALSWTVMMAGTALAGRPGGAAAIAADEAEAGFTCMDVTLDPGLIHGLLRGRSLRDALIVRHVPFWQNWLDARDDPSFFDSTDALSRLGSVTKPALHIGGWYDLFVGNVIEAYVGISKGGATPEAREGQRLWIGPWGHGFNSAFRPFPDSAFDDAAAAAAWFDQQLCGKPHPIFDHPVILYVMGEDRWRTEEAWPPPGSQQISYYLHSEGDARSINGNGTLTTLPPGTSEPSDGYQYDPGNPVPTLGGRHILAGPVDQRRNDDRTDTLAYTSEPLEEDVEVTGVPRVTLHAASSATDTDWFVKLVDVSASGESCNLAMGSVRARYRMSRTQPIALTPSEIVCYEIALTPTSNVFKKGHRIRLVVSSSDFPDSDINPNAFVDLSTATPADHIVANQMVFHDQLHASAILLPVIPTARPRNWILPPFPAAPGKSSYMRNKDHLAPHAPIEGAVR